MVHSRGNARKQARAEDKRARKKNEKLRRDAEREYRQTPEYKESQLSFLNILKLALGVFKRYNRKH